MRVINEIIIHCSYTKPNMDIGVVDIRGWHIERGWSDVGYHYVIRRDGTIEDGRHISIPGAHVMGRNELSIGICLVGGMGRKGGDDCNFTFAQYDSLQQLINKLKTQFPDATIHGHREFSSKACPCFDVKGLFV